MWGFEGVGHEQTGAGVQFNAEMAALEDTYPDRKSKGKSTSICRRIQILKTVRRREHRRKIYNSGTGTDVPADDRSGKL